MSNTPTLLPPSATAQERSIEQSTARMVQPPIPVRHTWNADTCTAALLPWLAWALSVDNWNSNWTEPVKRNVIRSSIAVHRAKGTIGAVRRALGSLDVPVSITEWFDNGGQPHTFVATATAKPARNDGSEPLAGAAFQQTVRQVLDETKPVRSHYRIRVKGEAGMKTSIAARSAFASVSAMRGNVVHIVNPLVQAATAAKISVAAASRIRMEAA